MRAIISAAITILCTGCATIFTGGTNQYITIKSDPPGATVTIDGRPDSVGQTPFVTQASRRLGHYIHITKAGYEPMDATLHQEFNPLFIGDVIALPPVGFIVDLADGSFLILRPYELDVRLKPTGGDYNP